MTDVTPAASSGFDRYWAAGSPTSPAASELTERLGRAERLDPVAEPLAAATGRLLPPGPLKDLLSGTWLGHPLHPIAIHLPIGTWSSAMLLDLIGGRESEKAADRLVAVGILATLPAVAAGMSDWADTSGPSRRIGLAHAALNTVALALYGGSYAARRRTGRGLGKVLALVGGGVLGVSGYLGGHLAYSRGVGVDQTAFEEGPEEWVRVGSESDLPEGEPVKVTVGSVDVLLVRRSDRITAISNRCSHRGGPLDEGSLENGCVTCPWHGSVFRLDDGSVQRGPATAPQPAWDVRVRGGTVELRAPGLTQVVA